MNNLGLIFDLDGVITDTAEYHYLAWKKLADEEGLSFTREDNEELRGVSRRESLMRLLKDQQIDEPTMQEWMYRKNEYYKSFLNRVTPADILPGVFDLLTQARKTDYKVGLASASRNAKNVLQRLELTHLFDAIGDGHVVHNTKPAADLFVWVAGSMGLTTNQCIVFEDAEAGVDAALSAGMIVVGIGPQNRVGKAHFVCNGLHEFNLVQLQEIIPQ